MSETSETNENPTVTSKAVHGAVDKAVHKPQDKAIKGPVAKEASRSDNDD